MSKPTNKRAKRTARAPKGSKPATREKRVKAKRTHDERQEGLPNIPPPPADMHGSLDDDDSREPAQAGSVKYTLRITHEQNRRMAALRKNQHVFGVSEPSPTDVIRLAFTRGLELLEKLGKERAASLEKFPPRS